MERLDWIELKVSTSNCNCVHFHRIQETTFEFVRVFIPYVTWNSNQCDSRVIINNYERLNVKCSNSSVIDSSPECHRVKCFG